jgi:hypothetical protein
VYYLSGTQNNAQQAHFLLFSCFTFDPVWHHSLLGCELWGLSNCDKIERVHLKYCNPLLNLKSSTPNCVIHGELGRSHSSKIVCTLLNQEEIAFCVLLKWYTKQCTTGTFLTVFLFYVWSSKVRLHDQFQQTWREKLRNGSKTLSYRIFKETFIFKQYFDILGEKDFLSLCKNTCSPIRSTWVQPRFLVRFALFDL